MNAETLNILAAIKPESFKDRAFGCILGAFIGDSCGSFLEFEVNPISEEQINECMKMNGGGPFSLGPGQVTDDSELAFCLMWGLI